MSYTITAFLPVADCFSASEARQYLLEGALVRPTIDVYETHDGSFDRMMLRYDPARRPIVLRRMVGEEADASRGEAIDLALVCGHSEIAAEIESSKIVLAWEVTREELDEDPWFALHLWQAWVLRTRGGWLYAPGDGLFDANLQRRCAEGPSARSALDA